MSFILRHLRREQVGGEGVNTLGELEIPRIALEELIANALLHRDYFVSAPIKGKELGRMTQGWVPLREKIARRKPGREL
jgi:hypothetical protein